MFIAGGYIVYKGLTTKVHDGPNVDGGINFSKLVLIGKTVIGLLISYAGINMTLSGSEKMRLSNYIRKKSAQQYLWDLEVIEKKQDLGSISLEVSAAGLGIKLIF